MMTGAATIAAASVFVNLRREGRRAASSSSLFAASSSSLFRLSLIVLLSRLARVRGMRRVVPFVNGATLKVCGRLVVLFQKCSDDLGQLFETEQRDHVAGAFEGADHRARVSLAQTPSLLRRDRALVARLDDECAPRPPGVAVGVVNLVAVEVNAQRDAREQRLFRQHAIEVVREAFS